MRRITGVERLLILPHRPGRDISFPDRINGLDAPITASVAMHKTAVNGEGLARHEASLAALFDDLFKQHAVDAAFPKPAVAVLGEGRMIRHGSFQSQPAEPAIGEVEMDLIAQPPLGTDAVGIANQEHSQHQFRINRGAP
jgi:hypothetical protein